jgi:hypothetical protein
MFGETQTERPPRGGPPVGHGVRNRITSRIVAADTVPALIESPAAAKARSFCVFYLRLASLAVTNSPEDFRLPSRCPMPGAPKRKTASRRSLRNQISASSLMRPQEPALHSACGASQGSRGSRGRQRRAAASRAVECSKIEWC